ncbi:MAG: sugar transferase [Verrucomicrobia bacterium]|nr:sugar transferase [Verrucomicrobiota bacterium]
MSFRTVYKKTHGSDGPKVNLFGETDSALNEALKPRGLTRTERLASLCLIAADLAGWIIAAGLVLLLVNNNASDGYHHLIPGPLLAALAIYVIHGYNRRTDFLSLEYFSEHFIAIGLATACAMLLTYVLSTFTLSVKPSRAAIPFQMAVFAFLSLGARRFVGARIVAKHASGFLLVLGDGKKAERFCKNCVELGINRNIELISPTSDVPQVKNFGTPHTIRYQPPPTPPATQTPGCVEVALACDIGKVSPEILHKLIRLHCSGVRVQTVETFQEQHWDRVSAHAVGPDWLFDNEFRLSHGSIYSQIKRVGDILISLCALILLSPLFLLLFFIVRMDSPGPAIFRQARVGRDGRIFPICKFRTMCENTGDIYTQEGDARITRSGRWLRLFRLDEFPQLWNVLVGDMSLIGPRAEWVKCAEIYEQEIPHYHIRHLVHPGITGWAQVKYRYGANTEDALTKFEYDLYYIRHFSFKMDFRIFIKTIHTIIGGKGR